MEVRERMGGKVRGMRWRTGTEGRNGGTEEKDWRLRRRRRRRNERKVVRKRWRGM